MFRPSPERAVRMYVQEADDKATCRICGQTFATREDAASHVRGLLTMNALGDHCRIHGFDQTPQSPARMTRLPASIDEDEDDDGERPRRWSLIDLFSFRL